MWLALLTTKDEAATAIIRLQKWVEAESSCKLRTLRTDHGGEFTSGSFTAYCAELGVERHLTAPYSPQQNGVVERRNQTIVGMARSLLKAKKVPGEFWGEPVSTAVFILNRSPTKSVDGKTPFEAWHGYKPDVHYKRAFGCVVHVRETRPGLKKLDDCSRPMIFVGYPAGTKGYRAFDPATGRVHITRDAVFDESARWDRSSPETPLKTFRADSFAVEHMVLAPATTPGDGSADQGSNSPPSPREGCSRGVSPEGCARERALPRNHVPGSASFPQPGNESPPARSSTTPGNVTAESPTLAATGVEFVTPPSRYASTLDAEDDTAFEHRFRTLRNMLDAGPATEPDEELHFLATEEPC